MITAKELNPHNFPTTPDIDANLETLLARINLLRAEWGKPMIVTSGLRSKADHERIYKELAAKKGDVYNPNKVPWNSMHLQGAACDISDPDGKLYGWCESNENILADIGLWCEVKDKQARVHFQIFAPRSGKRFFYP